jgi:hypothetical protein
MKKDPDPRLHQTAIPARTAKVEILGAVITAVALGGLFWVPKNFWLVLSAITYFVFIHALVWHFLKTGKKGAAWAGVLFFALPIDIGIIFAIVRTLYKP